MDHELHVFAPVATNRLSTTIRVSGCVTEENYTSLLREIGRSRALTPAINIVIDLADAAHIEPRAIALLRRYALQQGLHPALKATTPGSVIIMTPPTLPSCPQPATPAGAGIAGS